MLLAADRGWFRPPGCRLWRFRVRKFSPSPHKGFENGSELIFVLPKWALSFRLTLVRGIFILIVMSRGKSTFLDWRCRDCNKTHSTKTYNKRSNDKVSKEFSKFCNQCRAHKTFYRKDTSKGSLGNAR